MAKDAKIELGGGANGAYVEPTIVTNTSPDMLLMQEETFGPVAPVILFQTDNEAIAISNDTEYRLSA